MKNTILAALLILIGTTASAEGTPCLATRFTTNSAIATALENGDGVRSASIKSGNGTATKVIVRLQFFLEVPDLCVEVSACTGKLKVESSGSCD